MKPGEEKLKKMLEEGKITKDQYAELLVSLPDAVKPARSENSSLFHQKPWQIWFTALFLAIFGLAHILFFMKESPSFGLAGFLELILAYGLWKLWKPAYIITFIFGFISVTGPVILIQDPNVAPVLFLNAVFFVILILSYKFYFQDDLLLQSWKGIGKGQIPLSLGIRFFSSLLTIILSFGVCIYTQKITEIYAQLGASFPWYFTKYSILARNIVRLKFIPLSFWGVLILVVSSWVDNIMKHKGDTRLSGVFILSRIFIYLWTVFIIFWLIGSILVMTLVTRGVGIQ